MIKFLTAFVKDGAIIGAQMGDMPVHESFQPPGITLVSVGSVVTHTNSPADLVNTLIPLLVIAENAGAHVVTLHEDARAHVSSIFHHASTINDLREADSINPLVANWLSMRLHVDHDLKEKADDEAARAPQMAGIVKEMARRQFIKHELTTLERFQRNARNIEIAASAWAEIKAAAASLPEEL